MKKGMLWLLAAAAVCAVAPVAMAQTRSVATLSMKLPVPNEPIVVECVFLHFDPTAHSQPGAATGGAAKAHEGTLTCRAPLDRNVEFLVQSSWRHDLLTPATVTVRLSDNLSLTEFTMDGAAITGVSITRPVLANGQGGEMLEEIQIQYAHMTSRTQRFSQTPEGRILPGSAKPPQTR